jgi:carotenoid cleavage dioxygenase-like enzyme
MKNHDDKDTDHKGTLDRRSFLSGAVGAAAGLSVAALTSGESAQAQQPPGGGGLFGMPSQDGPGPHLFHLESTIEDCEVEGKIPTDLNGAFYTVGPDPQYPMKPRNIPFDGEGHVSMFRIKNGRVDYRTRYVRNERFLAQKKAGKALFPMYRNPDMDDPSVKGLSRSTANTHIINHKNMLLALKEDSPPSALNLLTLETVKPTYTFGDKLPSKTFTAHPKVDSVTGNIVAFGYEADGFGSDAVSIFEITPAGKIPWSAKIKAPYVGMLHDFSVTENYIAFYAHPLTIDYDQMKSGGIHWSWNPNLKSYFGFLRRGGNGSDLRWIEGPTGCSIHVIGAFEDKGKIYVDLELSSGNPFPFMPNKDGSPWRPGPMMSQSTRISADLNGKSVSGYGVEKISDWSSGLPRQDDRYNTVPYRYAFMGTRNINAADRRAANPGYVRVDIATGKANFWDAGTGVSPAECCFAPKSAKSPEGVGYVLGVVTRQKENRRADLVILDTERMEDGPVATVQLPIRAINQVHGWWVREDQLPTA